MLQGLGMLWTLPNTALGLAAGAIGIAFGAHAHVRTRDLAVVFHRWPWGPGGALTLGNCILHTGDSLDTPCVTYAQRAGHGAVGGRTPPGRDRALPCLEPVLSAAG